MDRQKTYKQTNRDMHRQTYKPMDGQTKNKQTDKQGHAQTSIQTNKWTNKNIQTEKRAHAHKSMDGQTKNIQTGTCTQINGCADKIRQTWRCTQIDGWRDKKQTNRDMHTNQWMDRQKTDKQGHAQTSIKTNEWTNKNIQTDQRAHAHKSMDGQTNMHMRTNQ